MKPSLAEAQALAERGLAAQTAGRVAEAAALYEEALPVLGAVPELHNNLGVCRLALGHFDLAETALQRALALRPDYAEAHNNLGNVLLARKQPAEALGAYEAAIRFAQGNANAWFNFGSCLIDLDRFAEAEAALLEAVGIDSGSAKFWRQLGLARQGRGDLSGAIAAHDKACKLDPEDAENRVQRALALLLAGDFERGWAEYEWRWRLPDNRPPVHAMPEWRGEDLAGKRLLFWAEQGAGTGIQFVRYAALLAARGAEVLVSAPESLRRLFATAAGVSCIVSEAEARADFHLPMVSAARFFGAIPPPASFAIPSQPVRVGLKRGALVWAGNPRYENDRRRSLPLEALFSLASIEGVTWTSFQQGAAWEAFADWPGEKKIVPVFNDFYETALALSEVDFVVSADTAVAHLAASLGIPVFLMLPFQPDWRWLLGRDDSAWYPTMRLFRQTVPGRWDEPVAAVKAYLEVRCGK